MAKYHKQGQQQQMSATVEKLYECDICSKIFSRLDGLKSHIKIHVHAGDK